MLKTYRYRLYPSKSQARLLSQTVETCRCLYNDCLAERREAWQERKESIGKYAQLQTIPERRKDNRYLQAVHSHVLQVVIADLDKAFQAFFRRVTQPRRLDGELGEKPGYTCRARPSTKRTGLVYRRSPVPSELGRYAIGTVQRRDPRFKGRDRFDSFGMKEYGKGFKIDGRRLRLFGIGRVAVRWHRPIEGEIKTLRIRRQAGKWDACFSCEVEAKPLPPTGHEVGIDIGITNLIATSGGETVDNPQWYHTEQAKLRIVQRKVARRKKGGSNRRNAVGELQRQHARILNRRSDFLKKLAHKMVAQNDRIAVENLNVASMSRNRHLSTPSRGRGHRKSILDSGWSFFVSHLSFKAAEAGRQIAFVNPAYTSKTCSGCGVVHSIDLSVRWLHCECGLSLGRDHNAAINILRLGRSHWELRYANG